MATKKIARKRSVLISSKLKSKKKKESSKIVNIIHSFSTKSVSSHKNDLMIELSTNSEGLTEGKIGEREFNYFELDDYKIKLIYRTLKIHFDKIEDWNEKSNSKIEI